MKILKNKRDERIFRITIPGPISNSYVNGHKGVVFESLVGKCRSKEHNINEEENSDCCMRCPGYVKPPWDLHNFTCLGYRGLDQKWHLYMEEVIGEVELSS